MDATTKAIKKFDEAIEMKRLLGILLFGLLLAAPPKAQASQEVVIAAAASLTDALTEIGAVYNKQHPNVKLNFNFGSSGTLQKQIENGAPIDIFISAADQNMDELVAKQLIDTSTRRNLASNRLVLIVPKDSKIKSNRFKDVLEPAITHLAIGGPAVPVGMRAEEVFRNLGIWKQVQAKAVRGKDVREVLTQVELGNVEAGVVYATDAVVSNKVRVVATAPITMHKPIRYPVAVLMRSKQKTKARSFVRYLSSPAAKQILKRYKFLVPKK